jgi:hypothetical protein
MSEVECLCNTVWNFSYVSRLREEIGRSKHPRIILSHLRWRWTYSLPCLHTASTYSLFRFNPFVNSMHRGPWAVLECQNSLGNQCNSGHFCLSLYRRSGGECVRKNIWFVVFFGQIAPRFCGIVQTSTFATVLLELRVRIRTLRWNDTSVGVPLGEFKFPTICTYENWIPSIWFSEAVHARGVEE